MPRGKTARLWCSKVARRLRLGSDGSGARIEMERWCGKGGGSGRFGVAAEEGEGRKDMLGGRLPRRNERSSKTVDPGNFVR